MSTESQPTIPGHWILTIVTAAETLYTAPWRGALPNELLEIALALEPHLSAEGSDFVRSKGLLEPVSWIEGRSRREAQSDPRLLRRRAQQEAADAD